MKSRFDYILLKSGFVSTARSMKQRVHAALERQMKSEPRANIPRNFCAIEYYQAIPLLRKNPVAAGDALHFVMNAVAQPHALPPFKEGYFYQEQRPLSTRLLKEILGSDYKAFVDTLENNDAIRLVRKQGEGCARRYVLGRRYQNQPLEFRTYRNPQIRRRIKLSYRKHLLGLKKMYMAYAPLLYFSWSADLQLDRVGATSFYETFLKQLLAYAKKNLEE